MPLVLAAHNAVHRQQGENPFIVAAGYKGKLTILVVRNLDVAAALVLLDRLIKGVDHQLGCGVTEDDLSSDEIREYRGTLTSPGKNSPYRDRPIEENLDLFKRMKEGEFPDGSRVLRAKIDMTSPNINMRDPVLYRILHATHHRTGDEWCIYPMYDWAHGQSDSIEGITHSICTLEFEDHRPLYDWFLDRLDVAHHPQQIEFAKLALTYTMMSKRRLIRLVEEGYVEGWDDPRM
ncbi:MAG: glutamate--tRNA ligase family protein, partial [Candidatus Promineifilaceae bacterium]|nr:glutamate--tRNA ligase family protein [Candidatus Promineifilaceae bacterium]